LLATLSNVTYDAVRELFAHDAVPTNVPKNDPVNDPVFICADELTSVGLFATLENSTKDEVDAKLEFEEVSANIACEALIEYDAVSAYKA
jgi:hypothetical protein